MNNKISACLVVYNEEKVIERCLKSIFGLVDEIIIVHDGECIDQTLEIAKKYTDKIFIKEHIGIAEEHRVFALEQSTGDWILQIDADEFLDVLDHKKIKDLTNGNINGFLFQWELWNGKKTIIFKGLKKLCFYKKSNYHFIGIPQESGWVDNGAKVVDIFLHHRPVLSNSDWSSSWEKTKKWAPIHAKYFFCEVLEYKSYNYELTRWLNYSEKIKKHINFYLFFYPFKVFFAQLKNGLILTYSGIKLAFFISVYYFYLFLSVRRKINKQKNILDLGCGKGGNYPFLSKRGNYYGIDILPSNINYAKSRYVDGNFTLYDGLAIPYNNNYFKEVNSFDVLEHVENFELTLNEMNRVLEIGGSLNIVIPAKISEETLTKIKPDYFNEVGHLRIVDVKKLINYFEDKNFTLIKKRKVRGMEAVILAIIFSFSSKRAVDFQTGSLLSAKIVPAIIWLFDIRLFQTKLKYFFPIYFFTLPIGWLVSQFFPKSIYLSFYKNNNS